MSRIDLFVGFAFFCAVFTNSLLAEVGGFDEAIELYDRAYYEDGTRLVSDSIYEWVKEKSTNGSQEVIQSTSLTSQETAKHVDRMGSLEKGYARTDLEDWLISSKLNDRSDLLYSIEPKLDGVALCLHYSGGHLVSAVTRGDGKLGQVITDADEKIDGIPVYVEMLRNDPFVELRGEVVVGKLEFQKVNDSLEQDKKYVSPRHYVVGKLDAEGTDTNDRLVFILHGYGAGFFENYKTWHRLKEQLSMAGFEVISPGIDQIQPETLWDSIEGFRENKEDWYYDTDGVVVKIESLAIRSELGFSGNSPNWAFAIKHKNRELITKIKGLDVSVGRTGKVSIVGILVPVQNEGVEIERVALGGFRSFVAKQIFQDDYLVLDQRGDTVPRFIRALKELRKRKQPFTPLKILEERGFIFHIEDGHVVIDRMNHPEIVMKQLKYWLKMTVGELPSFESDRLLPFLEKHSFSLTRLLNESENLLLEELAPLPTEDAQIFLNQINRSKKEPLKKLLNALSIPGIGISGSEKVASILTNLDPEIDPVHYILSKENPWEIMRLKDWLRDVDNKRFFQSVLARISTSES